MWQNSKNWENDIKFNFMAENDSKDHQKLNLIRKSE